MLLTLICRCYTFVTKITIRDKSTNKRLVVRRTKVGGVANLDGPIGHPDFTAYVKKRIGKIDPVAEANEGDRSRKGFY